MTQRHYVRFRAADELEETFLVLCACGWWLIANLEGMHAVHRHLDSPDGVALIEQES